MEKSLAQKLKRASEQLEQSRTSAWNNFNTYFTLIPLVLITIHYALWKFELNLPFLIIGSAVWLIISILLVSIPYYKIKLRYKTDLVQPMMESLYPNLSYFPKKHVDSHTFNRSQLFTHFTHLRGEDLFASDNGKLLFSELDVTRTQPSGKSTSTIPVFVGLFIVEELDTTAASDFWIQPNTLERSLGKFGKKLQSKHTKKGDLIEVKHSEFNHQFTLRAKNPDAIPQILKDDFYLYILALHKELMLLKGNKRKRVKSINKDVHIALVQKRIYIGLSGVKLFNVPYFKPVDECIERFSENTRLINLAQEIPTKILK